MNHIRKQISLIIYCFPNSNEMILVKKKKITPPKNNSLKAKRKLAPGASLLLCCCISPDSRAGFWYICCFPSLLSSLGLASLTKEGASFHARQAGLDTLEGPLWLSHGLVSRQSSNSLSGKQLGGLLQRFISPPSSSPQGQLPRCMESMRLLVALFWVRSNMHTECLCGVGGDGFCGKERE